MGVRIGIGLFTGQVPPGSGRTFTQEYREVLDLVRLAETLGFDSAWVSEHHGSGDGYLPSLLPMLAAFAATTDRIQLGTGILLTPLHDPLRLAEDAAVVDLLSGGRLVLGLGLAWREEEFRMFAVPMSQRAARTAETVEILRRAWTGQRFDHRGEAFSLDRVQVTPAPERDGGIPIWLGGMAPAAIRRAGRLADGYLRTRSGNVEKMRDDLGRFEAAARDAGRDGASLGFGQLQNVFVWDRGDAWELGRELVANQLGIYAGWDQGGDTPDRGFVLSPPEDAAMRALTPSGGPDEVLRALRPLVEAFAARPGGFHLVVRLHYPGMDFDMASHALELFGERVLPALRGD
ncbi:MAG TPA: LLM class flavin-dependent oxidoreductase [Actinomycetota bacterium]|jgi:probable F420-dependent oxidoreductase